MASRTHKDVSTLQSNGRRPTAPIVPAIPLPFIQKRRETSVTERTNGIANQPAPNGYSNGVVPSLPREHATVTVDGTTKASNRVAAMNGALHLNTDVRKEAGNSVEKDAIGLDRGRHLVTHNFRAEPHRTPITSR